MAALPNRHEIAPVSGDKVSIVSLRHPVSAPSAVLSRLSRRADRPGFSSCSREQLPGATEGYTQATFCILEEDHTLGNLLRWMLMKKCVPPLVSTASCPTVWADLNLVSLQPFGGILRLQVRLPATVFRRLVPLRC